MKGRLKRGTGSEEEGLSSLFSLHPMRRKFAQARSGIKKYSMVILNLRKWFGKRVLGCKAKEGIWAGENANSALVSGEEVKPLPPSTSQRRKHLPLIIMLRKKPVLPPIFLQAAILHNAITTGIMLDN